MSTGLERFQQTGDLHFLTFSCARKRPILATSEAKDTFLRILEETRAKHNFHVLGYVVMPNHVHLLLTEPKEIKLSISIQVLKQLLEAEEQSENLTRLPADNYTRIATYVQKLRKSGDITADDPLSRLTTKAA